MSGFKTRTLREGKISRLRIAASRAVCMSDSICHRLVSCRNIEAVASLWQNQFHVDELYKPQLQPWTTTSTSGRESRPPACSSLADLESEKFHCIAFGDCHRIEKEECSESFLNQYRVSCDERRLSGHRIQVLR